MIFHSVEPIFGLNSTFIFVTWDDWVDFTIMYPHQLLTVLAWYLAYHCLPFLPIVYTRSNTPAIHNVTIDGNTFPMTVVKTFPRVGTLYQYATTLGVGSHGYNFTFSDVGVIPLSLWHG